MMKKLFAFQENGQSTTLGTGETPIVTYHVVEEPVSVAVAAYLQ
jgi:hypothetical protein